MIQNKKKHNPISFYRLEPQYDSIVHIWVRVQGPQQKDTFQNSQVALTSKNYTRWLDGSMCPI